MKVQIQQVPAPSQQPGARQRPLILVVDDEPDILFVMKKRMQLSSYDVATASDGEMALERIREIHPDLVLLDLKMPKLSGYQVCKAVRADPNLDGTLILVCSAANSLGLSLENHCLLIGADGYIRKPYNVKKLLQEISRLLAQKKVIGVQR
jgi:CheY-like chemotaxis protein